jgi:hypothetical protein
MENLRNIFPQKKKKNRHFCITHLPIGNIEKFEPRAKSIRDSEEGPVVFATPDLALATTF